MKRQAFSVFNQDITQGSAAGADAIMRLWAEYLYEREEYGRISFNFLSGFNATAYPGLAASV